MECSTTKTLLQTGSLSLKTKRNRGRSIGRQVRGGGQVAYVSN